MSKKNSKAAVSDWLEMAIGGPAKQSDAENKTKTRKAESLNLEDGSLLSINPKSIKRWEFKDRPDNELGDLELLADEMAGDIGQLQPCLVRKLSNKDHPYELIVGERRWRAALQKNIPLKVIIQQIDDKQAALAQAAENKERKSLSEYAQGMSLAKLITSGIVREADLIEQLKLSKATVNRLLSFSQIPSDVLDAIKHPNLVSARTAAEIRAYLNKGKKYHSIILLLAEKIGTGKFGAKQLKRAVDDLLAKTNPTDKDIDETKEVYGPTGRHIFTWRKDSNNKVSISFPKTVRARICRDKLEAAIQREIEHQLAIEDK